MKKHVLSTICMILCIAMLGLTAFAAGTPAEGGTTEKPTDAYEDRPSMKYDLGDVQVNGRVNSADARCVLRAAAKLDKLDSARALSADVNKDGKIDSEDARQILRVAAKLDIFRIKVELKVGQKYTVSGLHDAGAARWQYTLQPQNGLQIDLSFIPNNDPMMVGSTPEQVYTFTAKEPGVYTVHFRFLVPWDPKLPVHKEALYTFYVK